MNLNEMIGRRKSVRSYTGEAVDAATLEQLQTFLHQANPLYPDIPFRAEIVERSCVKCILPWITPQLLAIFTGEQEGAMENVGFVFQQLDLYLQSIGLGVCWLGMGKLNAQGIEQTKRDDGLRCVMMMTFGYPKGDALRSDAAEFKRKSLAEIADCADERLEAARLAPSSINSQPWYFVHEGEVIHAYCTRQGLIRNRALGEMNRIDMGIALAQLYVAHADTFRFFQTETAPEWKGYRYTGSFTL